MRFLSLFSLIAALIVSGCVTDPVTGERKAAKAGLGAGIGAAVGAGIGAIAGKRKATLIGAGVGALAGAGVGAYMDAQEKKLREELADTGVRVIREGDRIFLSMPSAITFETDSAALQPAFYAVLNDVAGILKDYEKTYIDVAGHTDSTGSDQYNMQLSLQRAGAVSAYLESNGILPARLLTRGYGESLPVADNGTPQGRQANRRVEIGLTPVTA
ncbi:MAG: OmpA family protein [Sphingomonadales bacterium]